MKADHIVVDRIRKDARSISPNDKKFCRKWLHGFQIRQQPLQPAAFTLTVFSIGAPRIRRVCRYFSSTYRDCIRDDPAGREGGNVGIGGTFWI